MFYFLTYFSMTYINIHTYMYLDYKYLFFCVFYLVYVNTPKNEKNSSYMQTYLPINTFLITIQEIKSHKNIVDMITSNKREKPSK